MTLFDYSDVNIDRFITHHIGNKNTEEQVTLSTKESEIKDQTEGHLINYFLSSFKPIDFYNFHHIVELELNEVYASVKKIFASDENFIPESENLAKLLYEYSSHPKIKDGEFNVVSFSNIIIGDEIVDAIGLFKSETNVPFIQMMGKESHYAIDHDLGFELKGIDKGCIVFNTGTDGSYAILIVDNISGDAQYWINDFLKLKPSENEYNHTKDIMLIAKDYVTKQLSEEFEVSKTEKIDLLNRTVNYFKENTSYDKDEFEEKVFQDENVISSFRDYDDSYRERNEITAGDSFEISKHAVKKQSRIFKSILKLDKNFHVYIHGDKNLIEKGEDKDGRKYYKIYYEKET